MSRGHVRPSVGACLLQHSKQAFTLCQVCQGILDLVSWWQAPQQGVTLHFIAAMALLSNVHVFYVLLIE